MAALTEVGALSGPNGAPCALSVVRGLLHLNIALEVFCADGWKQLIRTRTIHDGESPDGICHLTTTDQSVYQTRPGDLIRVRIPPEKR